jgi:hypothetical protein
MSKMPRRKKRKREISISSFHLKRREEPLLKDTTVVEKVAVFEVSSRFGRLLSSLIIGVGVLLFFFSLHVLVTTTELSIPWLRSFFNSFVGFINLEMFFTPQTEKITMGILGFFGVLNTLCGLLLLTKE